MKFCEKEEGRRKKEEGRRKKEEGRRKKEERKILRCLNFKAFDLFGTFPL
ncbi:MAG: hypothetical protein F6K48_00250 [Okeania sp. SIO3H1]|nr:hypothetical protein [Okeania sp. SIO3H1]